MRAACIIDTEIWIWCWTMPATKSLLWFLLGTVAPASSIRDAGIQDFQHGRFSEALVKLEQAVKTDASDMQARLYLALTQAARNDCKLALPELTAAGKLADGGLARLAGLAA